MNIARFIIGAIILIALSAGSVDKAVAQTVGLCTDASGATVPCTISFTKSGTYASAGTPQMALSVGGTAVALTVPTGSLFVQICVESNAIRYRDDGTAPTASVGMPVPSGTCFPYAGPLSAVKFISQSGTATIDVSYYK